MDLRNEVDKSLEKLPSVTINTGSNQFGLATLLVIMTAFAFGISLGHSLELIRLWIMALLNFPGSPC